MQQSKILKLIEEAENRRNIVKVSQKEKCNKLTFSFNSKRTKVYSSTQQKIFFQQKNNNVNQSERKQKFYKYIKTILY